MTWRKVWTFNSYLFFVPLLFYLPFFRNSIHKTCRFLRFLELFQPPICTRNMQFLSFLHSACLLLHLFFHFWRVRWFLIWEDRWMLIVSVSLVFPTFFCCNSASSRTFLPGFELFSHNFIPRNVTCPVVGKWKPFNHVGYYSLIRTPGYTQIKEGFCECLVARKQAVKMFAEALLVLAKFFTS